MIAKAKKHLKQGTLMKAIFIKIFSLFKEPSAIVTMFPLKSTKNNMLYFGENISSYSNQEYYPFIYQEKKHVYRSKDWNLPKVEIIRGQKTSRVRINGIVDEKFVLPIGVKEPSTELKIQIDEKNIDVSEFTPNRVIYLPFDGKSDISISSNKSVIMGDILLLEQKKKTKYKLVLQLFVDGFGAQAFNSDDEFRNIMPNTYSFFNDGIKCSKCYSNGEWTLPSSAAIMTGNYTSHHGLYHDSKAHYINEKTKLVSEYFKEAGYFTFAITGNWRQSPLYGYYKGFDRMLYRSCVDIGMDIHEVIKNFKEQILAFPERSTYAFLSLFELHNVFYGILSDLSCQIKNPIHSKSMNSKLDGVSVFSEKNNIALEVYHNELQRIDFYLKELYDFILEKYSKDEFLINIVSDHGQSFFSNANQVLDRKRTNVMMLMRGKGVPKEEILDIVENVDILPTILELCEIEYEKEEFDGINIFGQAKGKRKKYLYSESIFPGQTYKACLRDETHEYFFECKEILGENLIIDVNNSFVEAYTLEGDLVVIDSAKEKCIKYEIENHIEKSNILKKMNS